MRNNFVKLLFPHCISLLLLVAFACNHQNPAKKVEKAQCDLNKSNDHLPLDSIMSAIDRESKDFVVMQEMPKSKSFQILFDNPAPYLDDILAYICDTTNSMTHRTWCIESQCKCDDFYYPFCEKAIQLFEQGALDEHFIYYILIPLNGKTLPFVRNEDDRFKHLLLKLEKSNRCSKDVLELISDIKSGYVLENLELYY